MSGWGNDLRPKGWTKMTLDELIEWESAVLDRFMETSAYDSGVRAAGREAYLDGLMDARRLERKKKPS